jgi:hypothetical protein
MNPKSPDRAIQQGYSDAESALARIAHVNRLSRDINDIKYYEIDVDDTNVLRIFSKKGVVEVFNADPGTDSISIYLQNKEITYEHEKFYIQLSVYSDTSSCTPVIIGRGFSGDQFQIQIKNLEGADDWGLLYFYFEIVKID